MTAHEDPDAFAAALVGSWQLFYRQDHTESGEARFEPGLGDDPVGLLVYDAGGHFSAQFMKRDRSGDDPVATSPQVRSRNNSRAVNGYDAYFGRYTVDGDTHLVTQTLEGALTPEDVGVVVTRRMEVEGDLLTLRLPTTAADGTPVVRTLKWRRVG